MIKNRVVIILVNYNGLEDTAACLRSIKNTKGELPFVVLVDNASDNSHLLDSLVYDYGRLHLIKNSENVGFGCANNKGIRWAQKNIYFEYLLLLNNDTLIEPYSLFYLEKAFKNDPEIGITTGKTLYEGQRDIVWYGGGDINYKRGWPKIKDFQNKATKEGANKSKYVDFVSGCVMMFSRKSISDIKGFDDDFFMYCEDLDLSMRAQRLGYKLYYEPKSVIYHKVQGSNANIENKGLQPGNKNLGFLFYHMKSNQYLAMKKNLPYAKFAKFRLFYWLEFIFLNFKFIKSNRLDIVKISYRTIKRINRLK